MSATFAALGCTAIREGLLRCRRGRSKLPKVGLTKRFWDVARSNVTDFTSAFLGHEQGMSTDEKARVEAELDREAEEGTRNSVGSRVGERARRVRDVAEEAWEVAYEAAKQQQQESREVYSGSHPSAVQLNGWYRTLEVDRGTEFKEIRRSYRRLLAKYHPDRFATEPEKHRAATEVAQKVTTAYNGLKTHLGH